MLLGHPRVILCSLHLVLAPDGVGWGAAPWVGRRPHKVQTSALSSPSALSWADLQISLVQACSCQGWALPSLPRRVKV